MQPYIIKGIGGFYYVQTERGVLECKAKGIFRKKKITPLAGDKVCLEIENGGNVIAEILPRKNFMIRPPIANLDVLFIVSSTTQPTPSTLVIDKMSAIAVDKGIQPALVITKGDLRDSAELHEAYRAAGIPAICIDYATGQGIEEVREMIRGRLCAFCGNSGVGKSTLLNAVVPGLAQQTADISQKLGRGKHTTREVTIFEACGGLIADTPGFASLDTLKACYIPPENLEFAFPEFKPYFGECKFTGCSHRTETGCAVREALQNGELSQSRYQSYVTMYEEAQQINEWERKK